MRFVEGVWNKLEDTTIVSAVEVVKEEVISTNGSDSLRLVCSIRAIKSRGDLLNKPSITVSIRLAAPGVFEVEAKHFLGRSVLVEPRTELFPGTKVKKMGKATARAHTESHYTTLTCNDGEGSVRVDTGPASFSIDFYDAKGKLLTRIGKDCISWALKMNADSSLATREHASTTTLDPYHRSKARRQGYMVMSPSLDVGEKVYGLGEQFGPLIKNGQTVELSNEDGGTSSSMAYKNVPFYLTSKGYGVYIDHTQHISLEVQTERRSKVQASVPGENIRMYIIGGPTPKDVLTRYTFLTGRPSLPPPVTWGVWLSTSFLTNYDEQIVQASLDGMKKHDINVSVFHFDCFWMSGFEWCSFRFDPITFPDPKGFLGRIHSQGIKVSVWINPYIAQEARLFAEGDEKGYFLHRTDGSTYQSDDWQPGIAFVDFTNPQAKEWFQKQLELLIDTGVDYFKTDFGERIPTEDVVYHSGAEPRAMHNYYSLLYNQAVFELLEKKKGKGEACLFARSATTGSQRFPVHWAGDSDASFTGMSEALRGGLSLGLSGFGYHSQDIGGFKAEGKGGQGSDSLSQPMIYKRWVQYGLLSTHSRLHGSGTSRVPWLIDDEACLVLSKFTKLKTRLMPYLLSGAIEQTVKQGHPMMRAMLLEFPDDPIAWFLDSQFMFGDSILVAPVFDDSQVRYYLPNGTWTHLLDGRSIEGGRYIDESYSVFSLPLFLRPGRAIIVANADSKIEDDIRQSGFTVCVAKSTLVEAGSKPVVASVTLLDGQRITANVWLCKEGKARVELKEGKVGRNVGINVCLLDHQAGGLDGLSHSS